MAVHQQLPVSLVGHFHGVLEWGCLDMSNGTSRVFMSLSQATHYSLCPSCSQTLANQHPNDSDLNGSGWLIPPICFPLQKATREGTVAGREGSMWDRLDAPVSKVSKLGLWGVQS